MEDQLTLIKFDEGTSAVTRNPYLTFFKDSLCKVCLYGTNSPKVSGKRLAINGKVSKFYEPFDYNLLSFVEPADGVD